MLLDVEELGICSVANDTSDLCFKKIRHTDSNTASPVYFLE
jgi:hypothetical protein